MAAVGKGVGRDIDHADDQRRTGKDKIKLSGAENDFAGNGHAGIVRISDRISAPNAAAPKVGGNYPGQAIFRKVEILCQRGVRRRQEMVHSRRQARVCARTSCAFSLSHICLRVGRGSVRKLPIGAW
jgi:hypothetical protein